MKVINSEESSTELNYVLNKITGCAVAAGIDKKLFMPEVPDLKKEVEKRLDEVNPKKETPATGNRDHRKDYYTAGKNIINSKVIIESCLPAVAEEKPLF